MDRKIYHGDLRPADIAQALMGEFNRGNLRAQIIGQADNLAVQIATRPGASSGGETGLTVTLRKSVDGLLIQEGGQQWLGTAASLGRTTVAALINPWNLLGHLDDLAQDVQNLQLSDRVWYVIDQAARAHGATQQLAERLSRISCEYCGSANPVGGAACIACGAPLGKAQPGTCPTCGFVVQRGEDVCPNCGRDLRNAGPRSS
jgi:hypothetical protein